MDPILNEIVEKMKCTNCTGYLRPPIYYCRDGTNVCWRCKDIVTTTVGINSCLETIGNLLSFPCKYAGNNCALKVLWKDLELHENGCSYRQCTCPKCQWIGIASALELHILSSHNEDGLYINTSITSITNCTNNFYCLDINSDIYFAIVNYNLNTEVILFNLKSLKPLNQTKKYFELKISANSNEYIDFKEIEYTINWNLNEEAAIKVDVHILKMKLKVKSTDSLKIDFQVLTRQSVCNMMNESAWNDLECPVCHDYMAAPIYQCVVGHSICSYCKPKLQFCPSCRSQFSTSIRNYTLESISDKLCYKCMYTGKGCTFTSLLGQMQQHEVECDYGQCDCPVKDFMSCSWRGHFDQMRSHVTSEHGFKFC